MRIIARTAPIEQPHWQEILASAIRSGDELLRQLNLQDASLNISDQAAKDFPVLVPRTYLERMEVGNPLDPLLLQVLPRQQETEQVSGYITDPLGEADANVQPGIIHKYDGRLLLITATGCAVNCRYCFRRHFDYADNRISRRQWNASLDYVRNDSSISEVILSGGDPLMLKDSQFIDLVDAIEAIPHVRRLRIHSRLPVVIPQRVTPELAARLAASRLSTSMVLHINHSHEISPALEMAVAQLKQAGVTLLNQSVLLNGVNNDVDTLQQLSENLFDAGILPYYLHLMDEVQGAHHFDTGKQQALQLYQQLHARLPGYLLPRLVKEQAGKAGKTLILSNNSEIS